MMTAPVSDKPRIDFVDGKFWLNQSCVQALEKRCKDFLSIRIVSIDSELYIIPATAEWLIDVRIVQDKRYFHSDKLRVAIGKTSTRIFVEPAIIGYWGKVFRLVCRDIKKNEL